MGPYSAIREDITRNFTRSNSMELASSIFIAATLLTTIAFAFDCVPTK
jgi:hypothetical protein